MQRSAFASSARIFDKACDTCIHIRRRHHVRVGDAHIAFHRDSQIGNEKFLAVRLEIKNLDGIRLERVNISRSFFGGINRSRPLHHAIAYNVTQLIFKWRQRIHRIETLSVRLDKTIRTVHLNPGMVDTFGQMHLSA